MEILLLRPKMITREVLSLLNELSDTSKLPLSEARHILELQIDRNHYTYCMYDNGIPIGIASFVILSKLIHNGGRSAIVEDVAIRKDFQHKGLGRKLVIFVCQKAFQYNVYKIFLNCSQENEEFYRKCGFRKCGSQMRRDK